MKAFLKGIALGLSLVVVNKLCCYLFDSFPVSIIMWLSGIVFFMVTTAFLVSEDVLKLLVCGFTGLFFMFAGEITVMVKDLFIIVPAFDGLKLLCYEGGFFGSMASLVVSIILTAKQIKISDIIFLEGKTVLNDLDKKLKIKLLIFAFVSAIGFSYLVLPENAAISVPVYAIIQFLCLWFVVPNRKKLFLFIPIFIMSLNCFISASNIWRVSNLILSCVLYCCMFTDFDFKSDKLGYFRKILDRIATPFTYFALPFKWTLELNSEKAPVIKRIAIALACAVPCVVILMLVLSNADMVFSLKTESFFEDTFDSFNFSSVWKIICGIIAGLFLFGTVLNAHLPGKDTAEEKSDRKGDMLIINILLCAILFVYTMFVIIQFKYLFAGSALPEGLTFTEYARKGFFELLALTGVNIAVILSVVRLTKNHEGKWCIFTKILCHYLCAVTVVLLVSSFYRMLLYTNDDGLTRLRFFVLGFLIFESIGLLITFAYIAKPKFNITLIYIVIALTYYCVLNLTPTDNIIAKNQIDKYLNHERDGLGYIFTLSADAAPAMEYLWENIQDEKDVIIYGRMNYHTVQDRLELFFENETYFDIPERWQRYNLSVERAKNVVDKNKFLQEYIKRVNSAY